MTPRIAMFILLLIGSIMMLGRAGLEVGSWLIERDHSFVPWLGLACALVGTFLLCVHFASSLLDDVPARTRQRGSSSYLVLAALAIAGVTLIACSSCATFKEQGRALAGDIVDCTTEQAEQLDGQFGPVVDKVLELATGDDGGIDWPTVKDSTKQLATDAAKCVLARAVARLMKPPTSNADAPQSERLEVDRERLMSAWRQHVDGRIYRTPDGDL